MCVCHSQQASARVHRGGGRAARTAAEKQESHLNAECRNGSLFGGRTGARLTAV